MLKTLVLSTFTSALLATAAAAQETPVVIPTSNEVAARLDGEYEVDKRRDQGWNAPWGLVFTFNNVFVNGAILSNYQNLGAAGALMLNEDFMIRGGFSFSRTSTPPQTTETTTDANGVVTKTHAFAGGQTSSGAFTVRGDAVWRLMRNKVAPYVGAGPYITFSHARQSTTDDVSVDNVVTEVANRNTAVTFGLRGLAGAEWRIHSNFAIFAEYQLSVDVIQYSNIDNRTTVTDNTTGVTVTNSVHTERSVPAWFNASNALAQGASLGLMVLF
jgi:opacity protein-like surface antigen